MLTDNEEKIICEATMEFYNNGMSLNRSCFRDLAQVLIFTFFYKEITTSWVQIAERSYDMDETFFAKTLKTNHKT